MVTRIYKRKGFFNDLRATSTDWNVILRDQPKTRRSLPTLSGSTSKRTAFGVWMNSSAASSSEEQQFVYGNYLIIGLVQFEPRLNGSGDQKKMHGFTVIIYMQ